jgi:hypothetical protein
MSPVQQPRSVVDFASDLTRKSGTPDSELPYVFRSACGPVHRGACVLSMIERLTLEFNVARNGAEASSWHAGSRMIYLIIFKQRPMMSFGIIPKLEIHQ